MYTKQEELLTAVIKCLPYPNHISDLDLKTSEDSIKLTWRKDTRFKISLSGHIEEVGNGVLIGSDICILFQALLKRQYFSEL